MLRIVTKITVFGYCPSLRFQELNVPFLLVSLKPSFSLPTEFFHIINIVMTIKMKMARNPKNTTCASLLLFIAVPFIVKDLFKSPVVSSPTLCLRFFQSVSVCPVVFSDRMINGVTFYVWIVNWPPPIPRGPVHKQSKF